MAGKERMYRSFWQLLATVLTYSIGSFYFGYSMAYFNSIHYKDIHRLFQIAMPEEQAEGIFSGCLPFGALFGAYSSSHIINRFSRRQSFLVVDILAILATLMVLTQYTALLFAGRILQGFCVGCFSSLVPLMVKEFSPLQLSGSFGALMAPSIGVGFFSAYLLSYLLNQHYPPQSYWYITFGFPLILILIQLVLLIKVYKNETPKYLISHGRIDEARWLVEKIYRPEYVERIFGEKIKDLEARGADNNYEPTNEVERELQVESPTIGKKPISEAQNQLNEDQPPKQPNPTPNQSQSPYPSTPKCATIFAFLLQTCHQLSGINVVVIFGAHLAKQAVPQLRNEIPLIINGEKILAGLCGTVLLNKFGRRFLMLRGILVVFVSLLGLVVGFAMDRPDSSAVQTLIITCMITYVSAFVITLGPITWLYIPEIVQPPTVPFTTMLNWALACIIITLFPMIQSHLKQIFIFFSIVTALNWLMCYFFMVETKGKKEVEVRKEFAQKGQIFMRFVNRLRNRIGQNNGLQQQ